MKTRQLIEYLTGPTDAEVDEILRIVYAAPNWQKANDKLAPYKIRFDPTHPYIASARAAGGVDGEWVILSPRLFNAPSDALLTTIEHELTHVHQMQRVKASGADPEEIVRRIAARYIDKNGVVDFDNYRREPLEMQALARNAVSAAQRSGKNPRELLRSGRLGSYAPIYPGDLKRFGRYAYQMTAEALVDSILDGCGKFVSAVLTPDSHRLLLERVPPVHEVVKAHHMTISFNPPMGRYLHYYRGAVGQSMTLRVYGEAHDHNGQAVVVDGESENRIPHITVSCAAGVAPVYSNELLQRGYSAIEPFTLEAVVSVEDLTESPASDAGL